MVEPLYTSDSLASYQENSSIIKNNQSEIGRNGFASLDNREEQSEITFNINNDLNDSTFRHLKFLEKTQSTAPNTGDF